MPSHVRAAEVTIPEAEILADLYGIIYDLEIASELCQKAQDLPAHSDVQITEAIVSSAVIRYGRCLKSSVRLGIDPEDIATMPDEIQVLNRYFVDLRNKYVAHSVNPFDAVFVTASLTEKNGMKLPIKAIHMGAIRVVLDARVASSLQRLVEAALGMVKEKAKVEESRLLEHLQSLPIEQQHQFDLHIPKNVGPHNVGKSRKQKLRSNPDDSC